eukprot:141465-Rhodomonas_salina.1
MPIASARTRSGGEGVDRTRSVPRYRDHPLGCAEPDASSERYSPVIAASIHGRFPRSKPLACVGLRVAFAVLSAPAHQQVQRRARAVDHLQPPSLLAHRLTRRSSVLALLLLRHAPPSRLLQQPVDRKVPVAFVCELRQQIARVVLAQVLQLSQPLLFQHTDALLHLSGGPAEARDLDGFLCEESALVDGSALPREFQRAPDRDEHWRVGPGVHEDAVEKDRLSDSHRLCPVVERHAPQTCHVRDGCIHVLVAQLAVEAGIVSLGRSRDCPGHVCSVVERNGQHPPHRACVRILHHPQHSRPGAPDFRNLDKHSPVQNLLHHPAPLQVLVVAPEDDLRHGQALPIQGAHARDHHTVLLLLRGRPCISKPVSYTHLTLPTICSV